MSPRFTIHNYAKKDWSVANNSREQRQLSGFTNEPCRQKHFGRQIIHSRVIAVECHNFMQVEETVALFLLNKQRLFVTVVGNQWGHHNLSSSVLEPQEIRQRCADISLPSDPQSHKRNTNRESPKIEWWNFCMPWTVNVANLFTAAVCNFVVRAETCMS